MDKTNKVLAIISFAVFLAVAGFTVYKWIEFNEINGGSILCSFILLAYFINLINWGHHDGGGKKDELDKHIETQSAKIGYFILLTLSALILFVSEGASNLNDIQNLPLLTVVGLAFVILPVIEFIMKKRYKV
ncbi:hypothetical protein [Ornithinibacillus scapharcae]|uniref:hypothetical protein n=1 Tax=Ornithinibacillus scapharcae TaxID=1147159 RepID=UPI000225B83E|nr:hypothetical protein [Ornithinibacillus scapharcae]